ncbi:MAG: MoaD/ThiS family protein [Prevotella sp.]|nr:MoaD/ThiS family protein [Prevotella sp.]
MNNERIVREEWDSHVVKDGDEIVILKAFCGG